MMSEYVGLKQGKVHDKHEMSEYYCGGCGYPVTDHDSYCRECGGALHEGMDKSRWHELFGTPERAARTLEESCHLLYGLRVDGWVSCAGCPVFANDADVDDCCYPKLLEWLESEVSDD